MKRLEFQLIISTLLIFVLQVPSYSLRMDWSEVHRIAVENSPEYQEIQSSYRRSQIQNTLTKRIYFPKLLGSMSAPRKTESFREDFYFNPSDSTILRRWVRDRDERVSLGLSLSQEIPFGPKILASGYEWKRKYSYGGEPIENEYGTSYTTEIRWSLLDGNEVWRNYRISQLLQIEENANFQIVQRNFELKLLADFIEVTHAKKQLELTKIDGEIADSLLLMATRKYHAGLIPQTDLLQIELSALERKLSIQSNQQEFENKVERFLISLGFMRNEPIEWPEIQFPMFDSTSSDSVRVESLPEVVVAKSRFERSKKQSNQKTFPLPIQADARLFRNWDGRGESRILANDHLSESQGGSLELSFTLFDKNEFLLRWEESRLSLREAERNLRKSMLETEQFTRDSYRKLYVATERVESAQKLLQLSKLRTSISEKRFASGTISSRDLLEAQQDQMRAELQLLSAQGDWLLAGWTIQWLREQSAQYLR